MKLHGQCLCGAVHYAFEGRPTMSFLCHCKDCQRHSGSLLHHGIMVPKAAVEVTGELSSYTRKSDAGRDVTRRFCPTCGSGVLNEIELAPGQVVIRAGTLDGDALPQPTFEVYARSRSACLSAEHVLLSFAAEATGGGAQLLWKDGE